MKLKTLFQSLPLRHQLHGNLNLLESFEVSELITDSRKADVQSLFLAIKGWQRDGHDYLQSVVDAGVTVIVVQDLHRVPNHFSGLVLEVPNVRQVYDHLASVLHGKPSEKLICIGVTGTNGKTSTTYMIEALLNKAGITCGVMGTVNHHVGSYVWPSEMTTPDPGLLQYRLSEMIRAKAKAVAMEVSSHALDQFRADGVSFDVGVFTNLTIDHMDYHQTMDRYFAAKARLFHDLLPASNKRAKTAVLNWEDPWIRQLDMPPGIRILRFGSQRIISNETMDFYYELKGMDYVSSDVEFFTPQGSIRLQFPMFGVHNLQNAMAAMAVAHSVGIGLMEIKQALVDFAGVPGRLQLVDSKLRPAVLVDYAHSPDALENVLKSLSEVKNSHNLSGRIITIFGCGGDRDRSKRPLMAEIAERYSDRVYVTSDNPRSEDPEKIIEEIMRGFTRHHLAQAGEIHRIADRSLAIHTAIKDANENDVVLIAGKGHEDYQILGDQKIHFSDFEQAQNAYRSR